MMTMMLRPIVLLVLTGMWPVYAQATPADPDATLAARNLLTYLTELPNQSSRRLISGQWGDWNGFNANALARDARIFALSGQHVGLWGVFAYKSTPNPPTYTLGNNLQNMINWWNAGGLIEVSPSIPNPETGAYSGATPIPLTGNFPDLYTNNGNAMNTALNGYLDQLATSLLVLQNAGVVVLFRPYHEMNQPFFWWGASGTTSQFKLLWQYTFTYLTQTKGLHNLLFVWAPFYQNAGSILGKYPGDAYIDVVAIDAYDYMNDSGGRYPGGKHNNYDELVATGKPFALAEFGLQHYGNGAAEDLYAGIQSIKNNMPRTVYFMAWNENWAINLQTNASAALNDPWVQNRPVPFNISDALSHVAVPPTIGSADVTLAFTNPAYGVRYWTNTIPVTEISSLGGVLTYHQSIAWSGETTFYCAAAPCTNFQLASVTGIVPSAVLKDLPAETTVNIRVRARDIAGNVSPYSSTVQGTTAPAASASTSDPHAPAAIRAHEEYSPSTSKLPSFSGQ